MVENCGENRNGLPEAIASGSPTDVVQGRVSLNVSLAALRRRLSAGLPFSAVFFGRRTAGLTSIVPPSLLPLAAQPAWPLRGLSLVALRPRLSLGLPWYKGIV